MRFRLSAFVVGTSVLGILFAAPAMARPRDDAMSAAFRCGVIGEARQWLDCYYGAAQPVRAALGMPPAPAGAVESWHPRRPQATRRPRQPDAQ